MNKHIQIDSGVAAILGDGVGVTPPERAALIGLRCGCCHGFAPGVYGTVRVWYAGADGGRSRGLGRYVAVKFSEYITITWIS